MKSGYKWWALPDSNRRYPGYEPGALGQTEPRALQPALVTVKIKRYRYTTKSTMFSVRSQCIGERHMYGRKDRPEVYEWNKYGAPARDRTVDLVINSHTLYLLSYRGLISAKMDRY